MSSEVRAPAGGSAGPVTNGPVTDGPVTDGPVSDREVRNGGVRDGGEEEAGGPGAVRDALRRTAPERARGKARMSDPGEWETASPPPSVLYFRALVMRKAEPPAGGA